MTDTPQQLKALPAPLLAWYDGNRRRLPWREEVSAYRTWVSEIMLQQTRVTAVLPYFDRFMEAFPTVEALAAAPPSVHSRRAHSTPRSPAAVQKSHTPRRYAVMSPP